MVEAEVAQKVVRALQFCRLASQVRLEFVDGAGDDTGLRQVEVGQVAVVVFSEEEGARVLGGGVCEEP